MSKHVLLQKVTIQPTFIIIEDNEVVAETTPQPIVVMGRDWPVYSTETFPQAVADYEAEILGKTSTDISDVKK